MREGRSIQSNISIDSSDKQTVGYLKPVVVLDGLVDAFLEACRVGIPTRQLPGQSLFSTGQVHAPIDVHQQQVSHLAVQLSEAEARAAASMKLSVRATMDNNDDLADAFTKEASEAQTEATRLRAELEDLRNRPLFTELTDGFDVRADVWLPALKHLKDSQGRVTQAEKNALDMIVPDLRLEHRDGVWHGCATLRINTSEGVAEFGPVTWRVAGRGKGTQSITLKRDQLHGWRDHRTRSQLRAQLEESAGMVPDAVKTLLNAPFQELIYVVLHYALDEEWPEFVSEEWRDATFGTWVKGIYTSPEWAWNGNGRYLTAFPLRHYVTGTVAARGGCFASEFSNVCFGRMANLDRLADVAANERSPQRPWQPSIRMERNGRLKSQQRLLPVICECGEPASIVARVPEVPRDLLCACGRMPEAANFGAPDDLRFPRAYEVLRVAPEDCADELVLATERKKKRLSGRCDRLLSAGAQLLALGATQAELSRASGMGTLSNELSILHELGLVKPDGPRGRGTRWVLTDEGDQYVRRTRN